MIRCSGFYSPAGIPRCQLTITRLVYNFKILNLKLIVTQNVVMSVQCSTFELDFEVEEGGSREERQEGDEQNKLNCID